MLSRAYPLARIASRSFARPATQFRAVSTPVQVEDVSTAADAAALSGYSAIDFVINEDSPVIDAVQKFAAYNIGCLVTTDKAGTWHQRLFDRLGICGRHCSDKSSMAFLLVVCRKPQWSHFGA